LATRKTAPWQRAPTTRTRPSRDSPACGAAFPMKNTLTITDNRTGQQYELPIAEGTIKAMDLRQIRSGADDFGLMTYDPAYQNTAACRSAITFIDGDK